MTAIVPVPFRGDQILTVEVGGRPHVILKPAIEALGLDYEAQRKRLYRRSWARTSKMEVQLPGDSQRREVVTADTRTFLMLLATVDETRVREEIRPKLVAYQSEVADAIEQYWTQGGAVNPRATEDQLAAIVGRAEAQMRVLRLADGIVDATWLEAKTRHVVARALGEEPEIDPASRPLTVGEFLEEHGVTGAPLRKLSPSFGKRLKAEYLRQRGAEPGTAERFVDGALRPVAAYTEADRPLFQTVWDALVT